RATVRGRRLQPAPVRRSGASDISWLQSLRSRCISSPDVSWPLVLQWDWWRSLLEPLPVRGSTAKRQPDYNMNAQTPAERRVPRQLNRPPPGEYDSHETAEAR